MIEALLQAERLLVVGLVDQAERIYTSALEQDPLNAIAVVGLARVALERGDDRLAYQQARRALEIDPENAAAIRLELRLAEVMSRRDATSRPARLVPRVAPRSQRLTTNSTSQILTLARQSSSCSTAIPRWPIIGRPKRRRNKPGESSE